MRFRLSKNLASIWWPEAAFAQLGAFGSADGFNIAETA